jgi:fumarylacetoacetase
MGISALIGRFSANYSAEDATIAGMRVHERNETHDPALSSWVESANRDGGFPIQNLPYGSFRRCGTDEPFRVGVAIGDYVLDLAMAREAIGAEAARAAEESTLNALMALGPEAWRALRVALSRALRAGAPLAAKLGGALVARGSIELALPARIGDYTDFYTSIHHATNIGKLFRPDNPLLPNYRWLPIGYHGRASTINVSGRDFHRPKGQVLPPGAQVPVFGPSKRMDYELELGVYIGLGNEQGHPIPIDAAERHVFGLSLLNDWSARDIQGWEYQPLGPFLSKNFATTVSPWIVTLEALAPYRAPLARPADDPPLLPYLDSAQARSSGAIDIQLEVLITTRRMEERRQAPHRLARTSYRHAYWTISQLVAHHTVNGCALVPGDLLGTGTLSGPTIEETGALAELTSGGKNPVALPEGETRTFLEDGDTVTFRGWCEAPGATRIAIGEVSARLLSPTE